VYTEMGQSAEAVGVLKQALDIFRDLGIAAGELAARINLGLALQKLGDYPAAVEHHQQALEIAVKTEDPFHTGRTLTNLAGAVFHLGDLDEAAHHAERAVKITRDTGNPIDEGYALETLGQVHAARGQWAMAHQHWHDAHAVLAPTGHSHATVVLNRLTSQPQ
jgi:tetratricopeptide (TPR) repeat protein